MKEESPILSSESEDGMGMEFEMFTQLDFKGAVECMAVHKVSLCICSPCWKPATSCCNVFAYFTGN